MQNPNQFTVVQRCFVKKDDEILILMRTTKDPHGAGRWEIPGGKLEHGETPESAIKRELREETGIVFKDVRPFYTATFETPGRFVLAIGYISEVVDTPEIVLSEEHDEYKWEKIELIQNSEFQDWIKQAAAKLAALNL